MTWTVVWDADAEGQLARLWMRAPDRQAITESQDRIDRELRVDADKKGAPFGPFRILEDDPLSVLYTVDPGDCTVRVIQVRRSK
jgi:hypothetical protein